MSVMSIARVRWIACGLCLALAGAATARGAEREKTVDRMTDAVVEMLPMGKVFGMFAEQDPAWPLQEKPDAVTPEQLACVRAELSPRGYWRAKREEVAAYAEANPGRIDDDLQLLQSGAAELLGKLVMGGALAAQSGEAFDQNEVVAGATNDQLLSMTVLITDPEYQELRRIAGIGESLSPTQSDAEIERSGYQKGFSLAAQHMIKAMRVCDVPPSAYL